MCKLPNLYIKKEIYAKLDSETDVSKNSKFKIWSNPASYPAAISGPVMKIWPDFGPGWI